MARFKVRQGSSMPVHAPLIPDPFVPYHCPRNATLFAICRGDKRIFARYLKDTPFEIASDLFVVSVSDFSNCDKIPYMDAAVVLPVTFRGRPGGHYFFEYENDDRAIAAGRDLWGYPKKYAEIALERRGKTARGAAVRHGKTIIDISVDFSRPVADLPTVPLTPHFNLHVQPRADGPGWLSKRVIERDTSPDFELLSRATGRAKVKLRGLPQDPLHEFAPLEVLGGCLVIGNFHATEKHGWGRTVARFKPSAR